MVGITRRIAEMNKTFFSLCDHVIIFRHFSPNDIKYLTEFLGREWATVISGLEDFHFLHFRQGVVTQYPPLTLGVSESPNPTQ